MRAGGDGGAGAVTGKIDRHHAVAILERCDQVVEDAGVGEGGVEDDDADLARSVGAVVDAANVGRGCGGRVGGHATPAAKIAVKMTTSCRACRNQAQPRPPVSPTLLASSQPRKPATSTPTGPPGTPT